MDAYSKFIAGYVFCTPCLSALSIYVIEVVDQKNHSCIPVEKIKIVDK